MLWSHDLPPAGSEQYAHLKTAVASCPLPRLKEPLSLKVFDMKISGQIKPSKKIGIYITE
jgi:hypothetical protein